MAWGVAAPRIVGSEGVEVFPGLGTDQGGARREDERDAGDPGAIAQIRLLECHHRVKNQLQLVASLLALQARHCADESARLAILTAHARVLAIARLQQRIELEAPGEIDLQGYLTEYCQDLAAALGLSGQEGANPALHMAIAPSTASFSTAVTLALIMGELVTNAIKHARASRISIDWGTDAGRWRLLVTDDGRGVPAGAFEASSGLGAKLLARMCGSLGAVMRVEQAHPGASVMVRLSREALR
jgi:two-component sensor histidine kinase